MPAPDLRGATALVTGGAGFIGSHLVAALSAAGARVRVLDDLSSGRAENLAGLDAELVRGDVRSEEDCARACAGAAWVFHLAAMVSVQESLARPAEAFARTAGGTANVFAAAQAAGARRVVNISSSAVYGDATGVPAREGEEGRPLSPYAAAKAAGELQAQAVWSALGQEIVSLRFFNVYGPRQDPHSPYAAVIPLFVAAARAGEACTVFGDGAQTRDFVHVHDAVAACLLAAGAPREACGEAFNVGSGSAITIAALAEKIRAHFGGPPVRHSPARSGEVRHSVADPARAARRLGFHASVSLDDGLRGL